MRFSLIFHTHTHTHTHTPSLFVCVCVGVELSCTHVHVSPADPWSHGRNHCIVCCQHCIVHHRLNRTELAAHGPRTRDV